MAAGGCWGDHLQPPQEPSITVEEQQRALGELTSKVGMLVFRSYAAPHRHSRRRPRPHPLPPSDLLFLDVVIPPGIATCAPRLPEEEIRRLTGGRRDDYVSVTAHVSAADQVPAQLTLHVVDGRIAELELYAGDGVAVRP